MLGRGLLALGAVLLIGAAALHISGGAEAATWVRGERGTVVQLLWNIPAVDWVVVGVVWLLVAWRGSRKVAPIIWLLCLIPFGAAAMIAATLGPGFVDLWLLAGAALFAALGALALPTRAIA